MRTALAIALGLSLIQAKAHLPDGWQVHFDDPAAKADHVVLEEKDDALTFTTGPAGIYFKPDMKASGEYELSAVVSQLKTTAKPEGYGLFVGGRALDKPTPRYTEFLVRQDGQYELTTHVGSDVHRIVAWTNVPAMHEPNGVKTSNTLMVRAEGNLVHFLIDGEQVHALTRVQAGDGVYGVYAGEDLNVQVTNLTVKKR